MIDGTLGFRVLRKAPSHEKLYLLSDPDGRRRVIAGSANLSLQALEGRQQEVFFSLDDPQAYEVFADRYSAMPRKRPRQRRSYTAESMSRPS